MAKASSSSAAPSPSSRAASAAASSARAAQRRQARDAEPAWAQARHRRRDRLQRLGRELEDEAAVAGAVLVAAFEVVAGVAEQHRARRQQRRTAARAVAEGPRGHRGDALGLVPLLERAVGRAGVADDVARPPAGTRGEDLNRHRHGRSIAIFPKRRRPGRRYGTGRSPSGEARR